VTTEPSGVADDEELPGEELDDDLVHAEDVEETRHLVTDDRQISIDDAEDVAGEGVLDVVLLVGEPETGKTSLLVALWDALLAAGHIGDAKFAGSRTALGFERRAWMSRLLSEGTRRDTLRTYQEDNGFVHLRLRSGDDAHEVLLSDVAGETFRQVRQGEAFATKLPWIGRANSVLLFIDGDSLADGARRSTALTHARTLLKQLKLAIGEGNIRVAVILTMADLVQGETRERWEAAQPTLRTLAQELDPAATILETSARAVPPMGLTELVEWVLEEPAAATPVRSRAPRASRVAGRAK
jgi:hypothetical protein